MADDGQSDSILISRAFTDEDCATTAKDTNRATSLLSRPTTMASTISCTNPVTSSTDEVTDEKRSTKVQYEESTPTPRMASSLTPDVVPHQNKSSALLLKDIPNLVRHAPPPLTRLPVTNSHPLPSQSRRSSMSVAEDNQVNRSRKNSSAHAHRRKGSAYTHRSRSVSMSINNGHSGRYREGRPRNSVGRKRETRFTNSYQNAQPVTRMHVSRFSTDTTSSLIPYPTKGQFQDTKSDLSNYRTQRIGSEASLGNLYPVDLRSYGRSADFDRDNNQQLNNRAHNKRRTQSGTDWRGRNRSYGTSADDNEFLRKMSNKNSNPFIFTQTEKNANLSNGSYSTLDANHDRHYTRNIPSYDSLTEGFQQLKLGNDFSQDTIRRMPASSKLHQTSHSDIATAVHVSKSLYEPFREDISYACQGDTQRKNSRSNNAFFSASEREGNFLTRKQVGYGRQDAILPTSPSDPRFVDLSYFNQNSYEHRQDNHQIDSNEYRKEEMLNMNLDEQRNNSRYVQLDKNDERLYNGNHISSNDFRNMSSRSYNLPNEESNYRSNNGRCSEADYERMPPPALRRENLSPSIESTSSQSTWYSSSGDSGAYLGIPKPRHKIKDLGSPPDKRRNVPRSADAREKAAMGKRSEGKRGTKNEHKQSAHFKSGKNLQSIMPSEESSILDSEIEEEMIRARNMDIPVKFNSTKKSSEPKLNPSANSFAPLCRDANGNIFKMVSSKGVAFFHPQMSQADGSNTNYLIPPHDNETDTTSSDNTETTPHVSEEHVQHSITNDTATNSFWEMPAAYSQGSSSNDVNATTYFDSMVQANCNPEVQMHSNISKGFAASTDITHSSFGHLNTLPIPLGPEQALITGFNETSVNFTNNTAYSNNFTNDMAHLNYPNFPHTGVSVPATNSSFPQISNQNYDCQLSQSHMTALQISDASPDLNSPSQIPVNPFEVPHSLSNQQFAFQNPGGQPFPILINETSPYFIQSPVSPFIQTSEYNNTQMYNVTPSSVNSPVILAINPMTPSPLGPFPDAMPLAQISTGNHQMISPASFQTLTDNSTLLPEQSQQPCAAQPPIMNLQTYVALMENSPADANTAIPNFFPVNSSCFPEEKPAETESKPDDSKCQDHLMKYDAQSSDEGKSMEMTLIRDVIEKFVETVRRTDKESPVPLTKRQFADVLCGTSPSIINDVMTNHSHVNVVNDENNLNQKEDKSEKNENFKETQPPEGAHEQGKRTSSISVKPKNDLEIPCPPGFENERESNFEKSAFPIVFGFETETESSIENSSVAPSGNQCESDSGESGFVTPTPVSDTEIRESTEVVNPQLQICQDDERRNSVGNVSVEKRINYFEKHKSL